MESNEKYDLIKIYLTGFGPFQTITSNPTEELVTDILSNHKEFNSLKCHLVSSDIYQVKTDFADEKLPFLHRKINADIDNSNRIGFKALSILIHFGLNAGANDFNIEIQGKNLIKDEYKKCPIDLSKQSHLNTKLNCDLLMNKLKEKHHNCTLSLDAGTYLCNYIYFLSLSHFEHNNNAIVLFIHIPLFSKMSLNEDKKCFKAILRSLEEMYC